jgi:Fe2+ or Zn2+ uptake regulation protein
LYYLPNIVRVTKQRRIMLGVLISAGKQINACKVLVEKYEGKKTV